jgi:hypothetical protein
MHLFKRWRLGRSVVAVGAGLLLIAGLATPAAAVSQSFSATVIGGQVTLAPETGSNSLGGGPACSNLKDDEYDAPFTPTKDTLIDYPADPQCATPFDNDERVNGFQLASPISLHGTIDDTTGVFSLNTLSWPVTTLTVSSPVGPVFVENTTSLDAPLTGTLSGAGVATTVLSDFTFRTKICLAAGVSCGGGNPPPPYGSGTNWSADCNIDVKPDTLGTADPAGSAYFGPGGVLTMADSSFGIPVPTDAGPAAIPCAGLAAAFGFPTTDNNDSSIAIQLSTNKAIGQAKSVTVGSGSVIEPGPNVLTSKAGTSKITFPVTVNTPPLVDLTFNIATSSFAPAPGWAIESQKPAIPNTDFTSLDGKVGKIKAGKTAGTVSVTVFSDALVESPELLIVSISGLSDPTYSLVHGAALGTINDNAGGAKVSVLAGDVSEGSNAGASPTKPATVSTTFPLVLSAQQLTDTVVTYCTMDVTAEGNDTSKPVTPAKIKDYAPVSCALPKTKTIKAGKMTSSVAVKVNQDSTVEPDEALAVVILAVSGSPATIDAAHSAGIGRIMADD